MMMCMANVESNIWIKPPSPGLIKNWKIFIELGGRLERIYNLGNKIELFPPDEFWQTIKELKDGKQISTFDPDLQDIPPDDDSGEFRGFKGGALVPSVSPVSNVILELLSDHELFPFLDANMTVSARAAVALLVYKYVDKGKTGYITDIVRLYRMARISIEDYAAESERLTRYISSPGSFLEMATDEDNTSRTLVLSIKGLKALLGVDLQSPISPDIFEEITRREGYAPITPSMANIARKTRKKRRGKSISGEFSNLTLQDLVLDDPEAIFKLQYLVAYTKKKKGNTFRVLLTGAPGLGKSYTARCISGELHKPLIVMNYAETLNMYVGESEKAIARYFEEAREQDAILLIDEADSIITQRTKGKNSWQNSDTNMILVLLEKKDVCVIMATNFADSLDHALQRRIEEVIDFKMPKATARKGIWIKEMKKASLDADGVDFDELAHVVLSGGLIFNVVRRAMMIKTVMGKEVVVDTSFLKKLAIEESRKLEKAFVEKKIYGFSNYPGKDGEIC